MSPKYHVDKICAPCIDNAIRLFEVRAARNRTYAKRRRTARNTKVERAIRFAAWEMYDNTIADLNTTVLMIKREQAEHMEVSG